jgi:hypothetical protein
MAQGEVSHTCGTKKITYPAGSTFVCVCPASGKCVWTVILDSGTVFTGTELKAPTSPKPPHVSVIGNLNLAAIALQRVLKRRVVVPPALRGVSVKKSFKGTARSVAAQLGLEVTTKRA